MNSAKSTVPFKGTPEQEAQLLAVIEEKKDTQGALMPILQKAQEIYGYLPIEVQTIISDKTGIPLEKIYGVVTFYAQFSLSPRASTLSRYVSVQPATLRAREIYTTSFRRSSVSRAANVPPTASSPLTPAAA